jgi:hypothetical protein
MPRDADGGRRPQLVIADDQKAFEGIPFSFLKLKPQSWDMLNGAGMQEVCRRLLRFRRKG